MSLADYLVWKRLQIQPYVQWYDRQPTIKILHYTGYGIAPHASTERAKYTCPDHKKAFLQSILMHTRRVTAAAPVEKVVLDTVLFIGEVSDLLLNRIMHFDNNANYTETTSKPMNLLLLPGSGIRLFTLDQSTGGTNDYILTSVIIEFDY